MTSTKKSTVIRTLSVMLVFALCATYLLFVIFRLTVFMNDYYKQKAYDQITTSSPLKAERGTIYDANMNILAQSNTVWRVFISTRDIKSAESAEGIEYGRIIAYGLGEILKVDSDTLYNKIKNTNVLDVTVKQSVNKEDYEKVMSFVKEHNLERLVFTEASSSRYYPSGTLAAHVLGFTGSDNQGLYGLEYQYNSILSGTDGYYLYAKDANGNALDTEYSSYFPASNGKSLVTTIDTYIQTELEAIIEQARVNHDAENRVCGIVMDTKTGAILAMATTSPFDPNSPFELEEVYISKLNSSGLAYGSEEYKAYKNELLQTTWSNKAVSEIYEPGSTFKIITVSAALDSGVATTTDTFSCKGYYEIGGWRIKCHKAGGHGAGFDLAYGLQMSCNPCMISLSERLGADVFYEYVSSFGMLGKTGIDLPSEATGIFHQKSALGPTELATSSFGQRFKVSAITLLCAIAAVANDGKLITPYVVEKIIDENGEDYYSHENVSRGQVISPEIAEMVSQMLIDGVNGNGGAKNAGVSGYDIAAKTGTSQKFDILDENGNSYLRIGSTVAYSTDADNGIATIIIVDEPQSQVKYGSVVAAPYVSQLLEKILPYLEFRKNFSAPETKIGNYVGLTVEDASKRLQNESIGYEIVGNGGVVISQMPAAADNVTYALTKVILYTEDNKDIYVTVPDFHSTSIVDAIRLAYESGVNIKLSGNGEIAPSSYDQIAEQSLPPGSKVKKGTVVVIRAINTEFED